VEIPFKGKPRWLTKPGAERDRLIITYDPVKKRWYAHVSVRVKLERERDGGLKAGIDLGREIVAAVAVEDGTALLYRGGPLKSDFHYFGRKIAEIDKALIDPKSEEADRSCLKRGEEAALRQEEEVERADFCKPRGALGAQVLGAERWRRVRGVP